MNKLLAGYIKKKQSTIWEKTYSSFPLSNPSWTSVFNISNSRNIDNAENYKKEGINFNILYNKK